MKKLKTSEILLDPSVSFWIKDAIRQLERRDPVDARNDAQLLAQLFEQRLQDLFVANHTQY